MPSDYSRKRATFLAMAIIPLSGFATDIYIPSLPQMGSALNATSLQIQMTLSIFLISYGISQLFIGAILDSFGRYHLGIVALFLFASASLIIAYTNSIAVIYVMRAIHGLTVATVVVAKRAYFVDVYNGEKLKNYLSVFTIIWSAGPIIAPFIGGYLQSHFGWNFNFKFLAVMALVLAVLEVVFSRETLLNRSEFCLSKIATIYHQMLSTATFSYGLIILGFAYSMVMVYNLTGPYIIEHSLHLTPVTVGYCSLILGFSWMLGGIIGKITINNPLFKKNFVNLVIQFIFIIGMIISYGLVSNLTSLISFAFLIHTCSGYTFNNFFTLNMSQFPNNAGIAGGLIGGVVFIIVSVLSYLVVYLIPPNDQLNLGLSYLVLATVSWVVVYRLYQLVNKKS